MRLYCFSQIFPNKNYTKKYGQWALITGATDGIGLSFAKDLARRGHSIIVVGRSDEKLTKTKSDLESEPNVGEVITVKIDMCDASIETYTEIRKLIDPDNRDIGILINNAGYIAPSTKRFHNYSEIDDRGLVNVNILGVVNFTRMVLPGMLNRERGLIINVSSSMGSCPLPYTHLYASTKAFVNTFVQNIQDEYASYPIDIVNLTPGPVATKLAYQMSDSVLFHRSNPICPSATDFVTTAMNAMSTGIRNFTGCFGHEFMLFGMQMFPRPCLNKIFLYELKKSAKDYQLSPKFTRKNSQAQAQGDTSLNEGN